MAIETSTNAPTPETERYEAVIGIEVHCQLRTESKMFCACSTAYDGAPPNTHVCPVCLGLPGALPVINKRAVEHVLTTGLAIEAKIVLDWAGSGYGSLMAVRGIAIGMTAMVLGAQTVFGSFLMSLLLVKRR